MSILYCVIIEGIYTAAVNVLIVNKAAFWLNPELLPTGRCTRATNPDFLLRFVDFLFLEDNLDLGVELTFLHSNATSLLQQTSVRRMALAYCWPHEAHAMA